MLSEAQIDKLKADGFLRIKDFGSFKVVDRPPRKGRNPATGEAIQIAAKTVVTFKASDALLQKIS